MSLFESIYLNVNLFDALAVWRDVEVERLREVVAADWHCRVSDLCAVHLDCCCHHGAFCVFALTVIRNGNDINAGTDLLYLTS